MYGLKKRAKSNTKIHEALSSMGLHNVDIYLKDSPFIFDVGIVNLHPPKGTHCVVYINENYFDSYCCVPPQKLSKFIKKTKWILFIF